MSNEFEKTWENYTASWKVVSADEKMKIIRSCLDINCIYTDPLITTNGLDELVNYMIDFHQQFPGGHFVTHYFLAHHNQSIARWNMKDTNDNIIGEGISYGKYNDDGKLVSMTGFFATP